LQWVKSVDPSLKPVPKKSVRIEIIIEKIEKNNQNPGRDDIINRFDPLSTLNISTVFRFRAFRG